MKLEAITRSIDSEAVAVIDRMLKPTLVVAQPENAESGKCKTLMV